MSTMKYLTEVVNQGPSDQESHIHVTRGGGGYFYDMWIYRNCDKKINPFPVKRTFLYMLNRFGQEMGKFLVTFLFISKYLPIYICLPKCSWPLLYSKKFSHHESPPSHR